MAIYRVSARSIGYVEAFIEAESEEKAKEFADLMDGGEFTEYEGSWEWVNTEEIQPDELKYYGNVSIHKANEEED